jgi:hypothetical protein
MLDSQYQFVIDFIVLIFFVQNGAGSVYFYKQLMQSATDERFSTIPC